jgi:outer membrane protein TolC
MHSRVLFYSIFTALQFGTVVSAEHYSLEQCIDTAMANSKVLKSVDREMNKADAQVREARGSALPKVTAGVNQSHAFAQYIPYSLGGGGGDQSAFLQSLSSSYQAASANPQLDLTTEQKELLNKIGPTVSAVTIGELMNVFDGAFETPKNTTALSVSVNQPIYAQGKVGVGLRIARAYKNTLEKKQNAERHKIIASISSVYLGAIMARNNVAIQEESVKLAEETHRLAKVRFAVGKGTELDTLSSRLRLANAQIELEKAQSDRKMAFEAIVVQCGLHCSASELEISGELPVPDFSMTAEEALTKMRTENDQLMQLESGEAVQEELVNLAKTDYRPLVYASGSYSRIGMYDFNNMSGGVWGNDCKVAVGLSWELFSGATRRQRVIQKTRDLDMYLLTKKQAADGLELATRNAWEKVTVSRNRLASMDDVLTLARKGYTIAKKSFEIGSGTQIDMQNAELEYNKARLAYNAVLFAYNQALIELRQLTGTL